MMQLDIHEGQHLLHAQDVRRGVIGMPLAGAQIYPQRIVDIALPAGDGAPCGR